MRGTAREASGTIDALRREDQRVGLPQSRILNVCRAGLERPERGPADRALAWLKAVRPRLAPEPWLATVLLGFAHPHVEIQRRAMALATTDVRSDLKPQVAARIVELAETLRLQAANGLSVEAAPHPSSHRPRSRRRAAPCDASGR